MEKVLVAFTTNAGSTEEVAQAVGEELARGGVQVEVLRIEEIATLDSFQAVVVGAPMILGWHRAAIGFIKKHQNALSRMPVAYFCTAMSLTQTEDELMEAPPIFIDNELPKPAKNPGRLSFKERYATLSNYLRPILKAAPDVRPVSIAFFGGKLELFRLNIIQMLFVMLIIQAQPGDLRDWSSIGAWANGLRDRLICQG